MTTRSHAADEAVWTALVAASSVLFSVAFACATPFVALAAIAATRMRREAGFAAVLLAFAGNQAIGFSLHHYPHTANTVAWGAAIGVAALAALACAALPPARLPRPARAALAFAAAFAGYEGVLYAASFALGASPAAFGLPVVARIAAINAVAFVALLVLHRLSRAIGLRLQVSAPARAVLVSD